uniref:Fibroblast growth factor n=1 Tax=Gasterosteus aculeatus aculeatus TaxID=481459 RepID=A0AAQ4RS85_GASAC
MATAGFATLPSTPEDGGSGGFTPGGFKDPKRLYCKNGGFFLRIRSDGGVDGIREKSDAHIKLQIQATSVGEVVIKGVCANRYLAMNRDGRLFGVVSEPDRRLQTNVTPFVFCKGFRGLPPNHRVAFPPRVQSAKDGRRTNATSWSGWRVTTTTPTAPGSTPACTWL